MSTKYSTLPDIDDQPDVYETPDVSEEAPAMSFDDQTSDYENENVVRSRVSVKDASARFANSVVITDNTDFSDRLTQRKKAMYRSYIRRPPALETDEYELLPKELALEETSLQKYRRLVFEVQELNEQVEKQKEDTPAETKETATQDDLLAQISYLQSDLTRLNQSFGNTETEDGPTTYGKRIDEAKNLIKQLEAYKSLPLKNKESNETEDTVIVEKNDKGDLVTYELFYTPETAKMQKQSQVSEIDERIAKIEKLVGTSAGQGPEDMPSGLASTTLINSMAKLEQQITILAQPRQLEMVARRIKVLNSELDRLNELKSGRKENTSSLNFSLHPTSTTAGVQSATTSAEGQNKEAAGGLSNEAEEKVNHLFATMEKIDPLLNLTPALLTRLKALQGLHTEASTFGRSVKVISDEQSQMTQELKSLSATCDTLNQSLAANEASINSNIKVIDDRMTELVQRVAALSGAS